MSDTPHGRTRRDGDPQDTGVPRAFAGVVLDAPDPRALAGFYQRLLGWKIVDESPDWVSLEGPEPTRISFQAEPEYRPPTWPSRGDRQQMMLHLDFEVEDLEAGHRHAVEAGATPADFQPQDDVRVYTDPAGHPFCLFVRDEDDRAG